MPRYFFHIRDGKALERDEFGIDLPDIGAVHVEARRTVAGFARDAELGGPPIPGQAFEVSDALGNCLAVIPFEAAGHGPEREAPSRTLP